MVCVAFKINTKRSFDALQSDVTSPPSLIASFAPYVITPWFHCPMLLMKLALHPPSGHCTRKDLLPISDLSS